MSLVAALQVEIMDSLGWSPGYVPSEADHGPQGECENVRGSKTHVVWGYACPQTWPDLVTPRLPDLEEGTCELSKGYQNHEMTGSLARGMLLDGDLSSHGPSQFRLLLIGSQSFMTQLGMKEVVLTCRL